ncbi:uncharacterized protein LOC142796230 isoform X3 [Rhipicephalus microplus]
MPLLLRILRIQLGIRQQQRQVLQEVRQLKHGSCPCLSTPSQHRAPLTFSGCLLVQLEKWRQQRQLCRVKLWLWLWCIFLDF